MSRGLKLQLKGISIIISLLIEMRTKPLEHDIIKHCNKFIDEVEDALNDEI